MFGAYENPADNEYITRSELDERMQEMEVHGDGTTMVVNKQSGGTTLTCTIPVSADTVPTDRAIFVSVYNSSTSQYEISWDDFDIQFSGLGENVGEGVFRGTKMSTISAGTFKFDYSFISEYYEDDISILVCEIDSAPVLYWTNGDSSGNAGDTTTDDHRLYASWLETACSEIQLFVIPTSYSQKEPLEFGYANDLYYHVRSNWNYTTSAGNFYLHLNYCNPSVWKQDHEQIRAWTLGASFSDTLILGWKYTNMLIVNDVDSNYGAAGYHDKRTLCAVITDSDKKLKHVYCRTMAPVTPFGLTTTKSFVDNGGNTQTFKIMNGIIQTWTTT